MSNNSVQNQANDINVVKEFLTYLYNVLKTQDELIKKLTNEKYNGDEKQLKQLLKAFSQRRRIINQIRGLEREEKKIQKMLNAKPVKNVQNVQNAKDNSNNQTKHNNYNYEKGKNQSLNGLRVINTTNNNQNVNDDLSRTFYSFDELSSSESDSRSEIIKESKNKPISTNLPN